MTAMPPIPAPEGEIVRKPLQFFWLVDQSGSMAGKKIAMLNQAIREALPEVRTAIASHPEVAMTMRAIRFEDEAAWHVGPDAVPAEQFTWPELRPAGGTSTSKAIRLLASELATERMPHRGLPPVCILISDGYNTDGDDELDAAIAELLALPWGKKSVRLAIGIGEGDGDYDEAGLLKFVSHPEVGVLKADSPQRLVQFIKWTSINASIGASVGRVQAGAQSRVNVMLPPPPIEPVLGSSGDVW